MGAILTKCCGHNSSRDQIRQENSRTKRMSETRRTSQKQVSDSSQPLPEKRRSTLTKRNTKLRNMPIKEDSILEALCEKSSIEPQTSIRGKRGISVTKKERKRIFNQLASQSDIEDLFRDDDKMQSFIADSTGYSDRDREINNEIEQISHHIRSKSRSSLCDTPMKRTSTWKDACESITSQRASVGAIRNNSRTSMSSRLSNQQLENSASQQRVIQGQRSTTSLHSVLSMLQKHREKVKTESQKERTNRAERPVKLENEFSLASDVLVEATCENFTTKDCLS